MNFKFILIIFTCCLVISCKPSISNSDNLGDSLNSRQSSIQKQHSSKKLNVSSDSDVNKSNINNLSEKIGKTELVNLADIDKTIIQDLKYATENNFLKQKIYRFENSDQAKLLSIVAKSLSKAQSDFKKYGVAIKIWDGYRPMAAQKLMWQALPDERYVSNPEKGGRHTRGTAVDITLVNLKTGKELKMPTGFDDFSKLAHRDYIHPDKQIQRNVELLNKIMYKHGFIGLKTEWWHFDFKDWQNYPVK